MMNVHKERLGKIAVIHRVNHENISDGKPATFATESQLSKIRERSPRQRAESDSGPGNEFVL